MIPQVTCTLLALILSLLLAPLLQGIIYRVKSMMAGRQGKHILQLYFDLRKLWRKGTVYSHTTSWVFRAAPVINVSTAISALLIVPFGGFTALYPFTGDFVLFCGLFALSRFSLILGALDTGSAFEGMGAAREALFGALAEPVLLLSFVCLAFQSGEMSVSAMLGGISVTTWVSAWPFFILLSMAFTLLLLIENCRIPADDPTTHLELTMIHEVMILDHSGPDLAMLEYAAALKMWVFALLIAGVVLPVFETPLFLPSGGVGEHGIEAIVKNGAIIVGAVFCVGIIVGLIESTMARLRMERVPQVVTLACSLVFLAGIMMWR